MSEFKVGDRVYCPTYSEKILTVLSGPIKAWPLALKKPSIAFNKYGVAYGTSHPCIFHATPENHALLSQLYPNVEFEKPKAVGSDLTRQMLADGAKEVLCWVSDESDEDAITEKCVATVVDFHDTRNTFVTEISCHWLYAVPVPRNHYAMNDE
ncbi:MAG: hypothetical protein ACK4V8_00020 [Moraxella osloensis]